ncbi:MAG: hypothetical protein K2P87_08795 [Lachnospiraceae bacterium]|nr:hypothetical protein [Lachnospiraceae bacterium]
MGKKKAILALTLAGALIAGQAAVAAMAHGHRGGCGRRQASYELCGVEDCHVTSLHEHDGMYYCGHYIGDGHDYHEACDVDGCWLTGEHEHDGVICLPCADTHSTAGCHSGSRGRRHCR